MFAHGHGLPFQRSAGSAAPAWDPTTPGNPIWWHSVELGEIWQDTGAVTPAATPGDVIGRVDARYGTNFTQSNATLKPYLATLGSRYGARSDNIDDNIGSTATLTTGAKTLALIFEIFSAPSSTGNEQILQLGATPCAVIVRHSGLTASGAKGFYFGFDRTSTNAVCIQDSAGPALLSNGIHTLVARYDGVSNIASTSYRAWVDGVEVTLTTGGNLAASGNTRALATSVPSLVFDGTWAESILWDFALAEADCIAAAAYLEAMR